MISALWMACYSDMLNAEDFTIGVGIGACGSHAAKMPMCNSGHVEHLYGKYEPWRSGMFRAGLEIHHYSKLESQDFKDPSKGSGGFDYGGVYIEVKF